MTQTIQPKSRAERMRLFCELLETLPAAADEAEAYSCLAMALKRIEDEHTNIPYNPSNWSWDGRMYPPAPDHRHTTSDPDLFRYRSRKHNTFIRSNGALKIVDIKTSEVLIDKAGQDERKVDQS
ncbi:hypothetical protein ACOCG7_34135 (plasmid) [Paraburkholderia sp. DD10]|uniref:hypothetical protein n=1 Tax=Paraburkholderia sp. DD10 TaxID=3409691 RepID=UPI003BA1842D